MFAWFFLRKLLPPSVRGRTVSFSSRPSMPSSPPEKATKVRARAGTVRQPRYLPVVSLRNGAICFSPRRFHNHTSIYLTHPRSRYDCAPAFTAVPPDETPTPTPTQHRHPGLGLERSEVIVALANMVYGVLHKTHPWAYSKSQMYHVSTCGARLSPLPAATRTRGRGFSVGLFAVRVHQQHSTERRLRLSHVDASPPTVVVVLCSMRWACTHQSTHRRCSVAPQPIAN